MNNDLLDYVESIRTAALDSLDSDDQARLGQFFTPAPAAMLIASMPRLSQSAGSLRILDPGAGAGTLSAAIVARLILEGRKRPVEIVAVEIDASIATYLKRTLEECERRAQVADFELSTTVIEGDFIELTAGSLLTDSRLTTPFDLVIMNPPYRKLPANSWQRHALQRIGVESPNLYTAFLALGSASLIDGGELVAITPRSFANGPYFEQFRKHLLESVAIDRLHTFESRSSVFSETGVLQENVVFAATRNGIREKIRLTVSRSTHDQPTEHLLEYAEFVQPEDPHQFLRITTDTDLEISAGMSALPAVLSDIALNVSTGRVVDFRTRDSLRDKAGDMCAPLIYPGNLREGRIDWPREIRKAQWIYVPDKTKVKLLVPSGWYVLAKRFSAKEERHRIVAAVWDPEINGDSPVAFENHLNVFHRRGSGLGRDEAVGLCIYLNSSLVDRYFRTFSGHTQVNATDLRSLRYPTTEMLRTIGEIAAEEMPDQEGVDRIVDSMMSRTIAA